MFRNASSVGLVAAAVLAALVSVGHAQPPVVWVDDDWVGSTPGQIVDGHVFGDDAFATVQDGITTVAEYGLVNVQDGVYVEDLLVEKPLTLSGASNLTTILQPAGSQFAPNLAASTHLLITTDSVAVENLQFAGDETLCDEGVVIEDASSVTIRNCDIHHYNSDAIYAFGVNFTLADILVQGNILHDIRSSNFDIAWRPAVVFLDNAGGAILDNAVSSNCVNVALGNLIDPAGDLAARSVIVGNTITDTWPPLVDGGLLDSYGILAYDPADILTNTVQNATNGIYALGDNAPGAFNIVGNQVFDLTPGPEVGHSVGVFLSSFIVPGSNALVDGNLLDGVNGSPADGTALYALETTAGQIVFSNNQVNGYGDGVGIVGNLTDCLVAGNLLTLAPADNPPGSAQGGVYLDFSSSTTIQDNTITGFDIGVVFNFFSGEATTITRNNIAGNTVFGLENFNGGVVADAVFNWWGSYAGPGGLDGGGRLGDETTGTATTAPWAYGEFGRNFDGDAFDNDGLNDDDDDNDGFTDIDEVAAGTDPLDPNSNPAIPDVTIDQGGTQADPANALPILFDIVFTKPVNGLTSAGIALGGTAADPTVLAITDTGDQMQYTLEVGVASDGTVTADVLAGAAQDLDGHGNTASTSTDNEVTFDATAPESQMTAPAGYALTAVIGLEWAANDPAGAPGAIPSGVDTVEILFEKDGGATSGSAGVFPAATTGTLFDTGLVGGNGVYFFYSVATDNAGNVEDGVTAPADGTTVTVFAFPFGQDFDTSDEGWAFNSPAPFAPAVGQHIGGALAITASNNLNCFGFWTSPPDLLISVPDSLYHGAFTVSSTVEDPTQVPVTRVRVNSLKQYAYLYVISSHGVADIVPTSTGVVYDLLFTPVPTAKLGDGIQLSFDMLNFNPEDALHGQVTLDEYLITRTDRAPVDAGLTPDGGFDFAADEQGWSFLGMDFFGGAPPVGAYNGELETIDITATSNFGNFGLWQSPNGPAIAGATIYRIDYAASTDVADPAQVPQARFRAASENAQYTFLLEVNSDPQLNDAGLTSATQTISLYLYPHPGLVGDTLKYAFDLTNFDQGDSAAGTNRLHELQILSGPAALVP